MLTCKEASRTIAADELSTVGWRQQLAVKFHLLICRHCRRYARQMRRIGEAAKEVFGDQTAEPEARDRLRSAILDKIPPPDHNDSDSPV